MLEDLQAWRVPVIALNGRAKRPAWGTKTVFGIMKRHRRACTFVLLAGRDCDHSPIRGSAQERVTFEDFRRFSGDEMSSDRKGFAGTAVSGMGSAARIRR